MLLGFVDNIDLISNNRRSLYFSEEKDSEDKLDNKLCQNEEYECRFPAWTSTLMKSALFPCLKPTRTKSIVPHFFESKYIFPGIVIECLILPTFISITFLMLAITTSV